MEIALLHQTDPCKLKPDGDCPITHDIPWADITLCYTNTGPPHLINPRWRLPYDTARPPANLPQMEIALLPQGGPLLIDPRWRLPY